MFVCKSSQIGYRNKKDTIYRYLLLIYVINSNKLKWRSGILYREEKKVNEERLRASVIFASDKRIVCWPLLFAHPSPLFSFSLSMPGEQTKSPFRFQKAINSSLGACVATGQAEHPWKRECVDECRMDGSKGIKMWR